VKQKRILAMSFLLGLLAAGGGYWIGSKISDDPFHEANAGLFLAGALLALYLTIALHEFGHVAGGWSGGMRMMFYIAGPLKIAREGSAMTVGRNRNWSLAGGIAGMTLVPGASTDPRAAMIRMVAGGPLASLLAAVCLGYAFTMVSQPTWHAVLGIAALSQAAIFVATSLPSRYGNFYSDGARLRMLLRGGMAAERWVAAAAIGAQLMAGVRPRDLDHGLLERALREFDGSFDAVAVAAVACQASLDAGDREAAGLWLDRALEHQNVWPAAFRSCLFLDAAFFEAEVRHNPDAARRHFDNVEVNDLMRPRTRLVVEAAVLRSEGRVAEAHAKIAEALALGEDPDGKSKMDTDWLLSARVE
jgi:hypothetical protein